MMEKKIKIFALFSIVISIVISFMVSGCATPKSAITKKYDINMETETGHNVLVLVLDADVKSDTDVKQDAATDARTKLDTALSQSGSTQQNARESAGAAMDDINSILDATKKTLQTDSNNSRTETINPTSNNSQETPKAAGKYRTEMHNDLKIEAGKKHTWLNETGSFYGNDVIIKWPGCENLVVPNGALTHGRDLNTLNHNQAYFFSGTDQKDHRTPAGHPDHEDASVFADPSCNADSVTVLYVRNE